MFKQEENPKENLLEETKGKNKPTSEEKSIEIHTMPEEFLKVKETKKRPIWIILLSIVIALGLIGGGIYLFQKGTWRKEEIKLVNFNIPTAPQANENINIPPAVVSKAKTIRARTLDKEKELIGSAKIFFPEGALESDITIELLPELLEETDPRYETVGGAYSIVPEEINLLKPVTFIFVYKEGLIDQDLEKDLKIGALENGLWKELESRIDVENNMASISLNEFSSNIYALIISKALLAEKEEEKAPEEKSLFVKMTLPSGPDSDKDGLTDEEERVYQSNINNSDTDQDSYPDGLEIINLYSPLSGPGARLSVSGLINTYTNPVYNYNIFYPASFLAKALEGTGNREVMFTSHTGEFMEILIQDNPRKLLILDWYLEQSPGIDPSQIRQTTVNERNAVWSLDGQTIYIADQDKIYIIAYNSGARSDLSFKSTFEMMIKSFNLLEKPATTAIEVTIEDLKNNPEQYYGKTVTVVGYVKELGLFTHPELGESSRECDCFALTSVNTDEEYVTDPDKTIGYVEYVSSDVPIDMGEIKNNDLVEAVGEFRSGGNLRLKTIRKL